MALFSEQDKQRIEQVIERVEANTAGEVVVAVVARSAPYAGVRSAAAFVWAIALALLAHRLWPWIGTDWLLLGLVPATLLFWLLWGIEPLHRLIISPSVAERTVQMRAYATFAEHGLFATRDGTGLLVFISELEHRVVILGDRGLDAELHAEGWQRYVERIVAGIKANRATEGLIEVLDDIGALLAQKFPRKADDTNELPNRVLDDRG